MDLKTLYYNPDEFTDAELAQIRAQIRNQQRVPYLCAASSAFTFLAINHQTLRASGWALRGYLAAATIAGLVVGRYGAAMHGTVLRNHGYEHDILDAFDRRHVNVSMALAGHGGSRHINVVDFDDNRLHKPY